MLREEEEKMDEEKLKNGMESVDTLSRYEEEAKEDEKSRSKQVDLSDIVVKNVQILFSDLPEDLIAEIFSRVPLASLRSVRSTCKKWNVLSRNLVIGKIAEAKNQFLGFMIRDFRICALKINLDVGDDFGNLYVKQVSRLDQIKISEAYHCDGLLLCVLYNNSGLLVWNPYLSQRRWIFQDKLFNSCYKFALGYDNNRNHKILGIYVLSKALESSGTVYGFNIYEFSSNSWRNIDFNFQEEMTHEDPVTLKGNVYFITREAKQYFLFCFDFTSERCGPRLSLPSHSCLHANVVLLSCVRDEKLAILHQSWEKYRIMEIWVTNKIDYNELLWTKWMKVDISLVPGFNSVPFLYGGLVFNADFGNIFVDEENKIAVVFGSTSSYQLGSFNMNQTALIIGQDGSSSKSINVRGTDINEYFPSLVQIRSSQEPRQAKSLLPRAVQFLENFRVYFDKLSWL